MAFQHKNRFGDVYFLQAGRTKTGKPKYYFAKKMTGDALASIPAGHEIRENPESGQVTLRKMRPTEISPMEREMLSAGVREYAKLKHFIVDVDGDSLVVYLPGTREQDAQALIQEISERLGKTLPSPNMFATELVTQSRYSPRVRFTLTDSDERLFCLERWCFLGSIDDWFPLAGPALLPTLIEKYVQHLGRESFYELT
jgi:hypothetical protein